MLNPVAGNSKLHGDCAGMFVEYQRCYIQADVPEKQCRLWQDDYAECKMRVKEVCLTIVGFLLRCFG